MASRVSGLGPYSTAAAVTPHDSTDLTREADALYVGVTGDVVVVIPGGTAITFVGVPAGTILPVRTQRVNATNTTATDMVALYIKSAT